MLLCALKDFWVDAMDPSVPYVVAVDIGAGHGTSLPLAPVPTEDAKLTELIVSAVSLVRRLFNSLCAARSSGSSSSSSSSSSFQVVGKHILKDRVSEKRNIENQQNVRFDLPQDNRAAGDGVREDTHRCGYGYGFRSALSRASPDSSRTHSKLFSSNLQDTGTGFVFSPSAPNRREGGGGSKGVKDNINENSVAPEAVFERAKSTFASLREIPTGGWNVG